MDKIFYSYIKEENIDVIIDSLRDKDSYNCVIPFFDNTTELLISRVIFKFLQDYGYEIQHQNITVIINEIITNVNKSNITRDYYNMKGIDINTINVETHNSLQLELVEFYESYMKDLINKEKTHVIKISLRLYENIFYLSVINNHEVLDWEMAKIQDSIEFADRYNTIKEVFKENPNITDAENFGLILSGMMLKNINIPGKSLNITRQDGMTNIELEIPLENIIDTHFDIITEEIIKEIEVLPQFPDSILRLQKELEDPEWDYSRVSDYILSDSSLTAEILRVVNSPLYNPRDKIDKVSIAVKKIGISGLRELLYSFGSLSILSIRYDLEKINSFKEHQFQVALISTFLAYHKKLNDFAEDIYVAALMHDIGKIIVNSLNPELYDKITEICNNRMIPTDVIDNLSIGYNHSIVGAKLFEKWNFPSKYINAIKYHHQPLKVCDDYKVITYCVYLGNEISHVINNKRKYKDINPFVLIYFDLETNEKFKNFLKAMKSEGLFLY